MGFDLRKFARVMLLIAIIGIVCNQLVYGLNVVSQIHAHNEAVSIVRDRRQPESKGEAYRNLALSLALLRGGTEELTPAYGNLFLNPIFPFENMDEWSLLNHLLAWGGLAAFTLFVVVRLSILSRPG